MPTFKVWERAGQSKSKDVEAHCIYCAVKDFAGSDILSLSSPEYMRCGTGKSNPGRFIASDGSAREFTAYEIHNYSE